MPKDDRDTRTPPYVSFKSFWKLMENLKTVLPAQLDRDYMLNAAKFNGTTAQQALHACRFLGLVEGIVPTDRLRTLVRAEGDDSRKAFEQIMKAAYAPIFELDLESATNQMLREKMRTVYGTDGTTADKIVQFFVQGCNRAGVRLSSLIAKPARAAGGGKAPRRRRAGGAAGNGAGSHDEIRDAVEQPITPLAPTNAAEVEWAKFKTLVDKFPKFDPTWPDDLKSRWFAAYEQFMSANIGVKR